MKKYSSLLVALLVTALLGIYVWAVAGRAIALIESGEPVGIGIGVAVLVLPVFVVGLVLRELILATQVQSMANLLEASGELPKDELPRSPGGRIDREAADEAFIEVRAIVEKDPDNWKNWYHLAFAYEAAGDKSRARRSLRKAAAIRRRGRAEK